MRPSPAACALLVLLAAGAGAGASSARTLLQRIAPAAEAGEPASCPGLPLARERLRRLAAPPWGCRVIGADVKGVRACAHFPRPSPVVAGEYAAGVPAVLQVPYACRPKWTCPGEEEAREVERAGGQGRGARSPAGSRQASPPIPYCPSCQAWALRSTPATAPTVSLAAPVPAARFRQLHRRLLLPPPRGAFAHLPPRPPRPD